VLVLVIESVLFIGTQFSNLYTSVYPPTKGRGVLVWVQGVHACVCVRVRTMKLMAYKGVARARGFLAQRKGGLIATGP
jgi:hypothetical protein